MKFILIFKKSFFIFVLLVFGILLILQPEICKENVAKSIILCARVLIPSLFPFSVCVMFITKLNFSGSSKLFVIFLLSLIGGYPISAKLLSREVENGKLEPKTAAKMLNFCVNAGPAFVVSAVGSGFLASKKLGVLLLFSHITASLTIYTFYKITGNKFKIKNPDKSKYISVVDNFVNSAGESATITLNICSFVILFSAIIGYIEFYSDKFPLLKPFLYLTEVTFGVYKTRNIYLISFLLGFSGLCVWCQIISVAKNLKINILNFAIFRVIHGSLSVFYTIAAVKIFKINLSVFSNNQNFSFMPYVNNLSLSFSLLIMALIFIISIYTRNKNTKILEEFT